MRSEPKRLSAEDLADCFEYMTARHQFEHLADHHIPKLWAIHQHIAAIETELTQTQEAYFGEDPRHVIAKLKAAISEVCGERDRLASMIEVRTNSWMNTTDALSAAEGRGNHYRGALELIAMSSCLCTTCYACGPCAAKQALEYLEKP